MLPRSAIVTKQTNLQDYYFKATFDAFVSAVVFTFLVFRFQLLEVTGVTVAAVSTDRCLIY